MDAKKFFSILDIKAGIYANPFIAASRIEAIRSLQMAMQEKNIQLRQFAEDFSLVEIGSFHPDSGDLQSFPKPEFVISCSELKNQIEKREVSE